MRRLSLLRMALLFSPLVALQTLLVYQVQAQTKAEKEVAALKYKDKLLVVKKRGPFGRALGR